MSRMRSAGDAWRGRNSRRRRREGLVPVTRHDVTRHDRTKCCARSPTQIEYHLWRKERLNVSDTSVTPGRPKAPNVSRETLGANKYGEELSCGGASYDLSKHLAHVHAGRLDGHRHKRGLGHPGRDVHLEHGRRTVPIDNQVHAREVP
jgi:hypothetical protein